MTEDFSDAAGGAMPGIQPHGLLAALHGSDFLIGQVSANAGRLLGRELEDLLGTPFLDLVDPSLRTVVEAGLRDAWRSDADSFHVTIRPSGEGGMAMTFEAVAHLLPDGITVVEMERDPVPRRGVSPSPGSDSSLRLVGRSLAASADLECPIEAVGILARELQRFTEFDRVLVGRFEEDGSGEVVADEHGDGMESLLGLWLPASTLSAASRRRFAAGRLRYFYDAAASPVPLVPPLCPRTGMPLDLSRAVLRSPSATRVRQLAALEMMSGLTLPLLVDGQLWGLVVCQHRRWKYLSHELRIAAGLCVFVLSSQMAVKQRAQEDQQASAARESALRLVASLRNGRGWMGELVAALPALVSLLAADGASIFSKVDSGAIRSSGSVPSDDVLSALHEELSRQSAERPAITDRAAESFRALGGSPQQAAGIVAIPLEGGAWVVAFRGETVRRRNWARDLSGGGNAGYEEVIRRSSLPWPATTAAVVAELRYGILELAAVMPQGLGPDSDS